MYNVHLTILRVLHNLSLVQNKSFSDRVNKNFLNRRIKQGQKLSIRVQVKI